MPFVANTPESSLGRSDSLNPEATCRGITSNGRPCRRPIVGSDSLQPNARVKNSDPRDGNLYCWQHKEQASHSSHSSPGPRPHGTPILEERSSIDTLADRLGLVDLNGKPVKNQGRPSTNYSNAGYKPQKPQRRSFTCCFCFNVPLDDLDEKEEPPQPRPQPKPVQPTTSSSAAAPGRPAKQRPSTSAGRSSRKSTSSRRPQDLIPSSLDAATQSALETELARPYVASEEAGFIYMFWLTPITKQAPPPVDAARSLLTPPSRPGTARSRRPSDVVSRFADGKDGTKAKTMMLKIGRAANVHRRMNQWQRQCGHDIELLRYYPYLATAEESSGAVPRMTPHAHRVERLIHIELTGLGMRAKQDTCEACGTNHREWFEVEASREGVRKVDELIRKWVEWDEAQK